MQYKEQESSGSRKSADELTGDRDLVDIELSGMMEYLANLNDVCVVMPREEELLRRVTVTAELEEALYILSESELIQVIEALTAVTDAVALFSVDRQKLVVLAQSRQSSDDDDSGVAGHHEGVTWK